MTLNPITYLRRLASKRRARFGAREKYWESDREVGHVYQLLAKETAGLDRDRLLRFAACHTIDMSRNHFAGFGPAPIAHEGGRDLTVSLAHRSHLYRLLAQVEYAAATRRRRWQDGTSLDHAAEAVLNRMAKEEDLPARMRLLEELYNVVEPIVGGQAAESLACLPSPGMTGWRECSVIHIW